MNFEGPGDSRCRNLSVADASSLEALVGSLACRNNSMDLVSRGGYYMLICSRRHNGSTLQARLARSLALLVLLLAAASGRALAAPIAFAQSNSATPQSSSQATVTVTYTAAQTLGNLNVVVVGWNDSTATVTSVADSLGNAYALAASPVVQSATASQAIYYAKNILAAAAGANTVTVPFTFGAPFPIPLLPESRRLLPLSPLTLSHSHQCT